MKIVTTLILFLFLAGCALAQKQPPAMASPNIRAELEEIKSNSANGFSQRNLHRLETIMHEYHGTDASTEATFILGGAYYKAGDYNSSYQAYLSVVNSKYSHPYELDALVGASRALYKLGRYDEALGLITRTLQSNNLTPDGRIELHTLRYNTQVALGDRQDTLKSLVYLADNVTDLELKNKYRIKAIEYVDSYLREDELKAVAADPVFSFVRANALFAVGSTYFEQKDYSRAEDTFKDLVNAYPNTDFTANAKQKLEQIDARRRVEPYTVGAVLPLTGKHSAIAQKTLRGLQMGLGITGDNPSDFKLAVIDSAGNADVARHGVERLVVEDSTIAIVGDLLSKTAAPVAQKADELGVPIIGLSQKAGLTKIGDNVFRNALTSAAIVRELVQTAMNKNGHKRFAILYPNDAYGTEYANLFWDEVLARGGQVTAAQSYSPDEHDFNGVISRLVGTYYVEDRANEYTTLVKNWYAEQKIITSRVTPPTDLLSPIIDFDAIFIPDNVKALGQIASMLLYNDISGPQLLGTNIWNSPSLVERGTKLIENSLFVDAQSSLDNSFKNTAFAAMYKKLYNEEPSTFEAQAYDTGLVLRRLISTGANTRPALRSALAQLSDFKGSLGTLSVTQEREFTRPLAALTVIDGQITASKEPVSTKNR